MSVMGITTSGRVADQFRAYGAARQPPADGLILAHPKGPVGRLDLRPGAPPRDEGARQRGIEKVDRDRIIDDAP